jgi:hypothetical protein
VVEASKIHSILQSFCAASGQTPNLNKSSIIFSRNVDIQSKNDVKNFFPVNDLLPNSIYLGHPLIFNHADRSKAYVFIINKFRGKLTRLKANKLNHAGRLTYINSILASIPIYYMSTILFSKNFIEKITSIISFWVAGNHPTKSTFWASVTNIKKILVNNCIVQIHKGNSSIWSTPWCDIWKEIYNHMKLPVAVNSLPSHIDELWDSHNLSWNNDIINLIFDRQAAASINKVKTVPSNESDKII